MTPDAIWETAGLPDRRLAGLALNPAAPEDVLLWILAEGPPAARMGLCRDRDLPEAVVDAVVTHPDRRTRSFFAGNPHVDPALRARLVDDPEWLVRAHLASGIRLGLDRLPPPLPDWAVARMITTYEDELLGEFAFIRELSPEFRASMLTHPEPKIRAYGIGITAWVSLPEGERSALLNDPDERVREQALSAKDRHDHDHDPSRVEADLPAQAGHYRTHLLLHGALSRTVIEAVLTAPARSGERATIADNHSLPADIVALLSRDPDPEVRQLIAMRPDLAMHHLKALAVDPDPSVRLAASQHPSLTEAERAAIDYEVSQDGPFRTLWTPAPSKDPEQLRTLALSAHPLLRRRAAMAEHLPPDLMARLTDDPDLGVRVLLAQHQPGVPPGLLLRCFLEYAGRGRACLPKRPGFPASGLARYAGHEDPAVRRLAARDPELAPGAADRLTRDPDAGVRDAFARHPRLPLPRVVELLDDEELTHAAAANPALPVATMRRLAEGP
ncbi:hypothetical protein ACIBCO_08555 [Streptomyces violascens]|uniref:hypothetical protein n=1 Tax=Streptomyces violascens TaxID=67381 RepID=UPI00379FE7A8